MIIKLILFNILFLLNGSLLADDGNLELPHFSRRGPTCGVRSLFVAMRAMKIDVQYKELIRKEYVGNSLGSEIGELSLAAQRFDLNSLKATNLTYRDLCRSKYPILLHMRSSGAKIEFDHWITFLGLEDGRIRIFDPSFGHETVGVGDLISNWSGTGLILSPPGQPAHTGNYISFLEILAFVLLVSSLLFFIHKALELKTANQNSNSTIGWQLSSMALVILLLSVVVHFGSNIGFAQNPTAVAEVLRRYSSLEFQEVEKEDLIEMKANGAVLVDSRLTKDYLSGSIDGAISLPVASSLTRRQQVLRNIDKSQAIVVFCQSSSCMFSDEVGQFLKFNGYENIHIYRDGFVDWISND
ncbi:MAG: rhodanese-like domain-containing protein [Mariniblastus sp.]